MAGRFAKRLFQNICCMEHLLKRQKSYKNLVCGTLTRFHSSKDSKTDKVVDVVNDEIDAPCVSLRATTVEKKIDEEPGVAKYRSDDDDLSDGKWKLEHAWLSKALEPALQLCRWALPTGSEAGSRPPPISRSLLEIISSIQKSRLGIQDWTLSDLTIGLYLLYLRQASTNAVEDVKGVQISSDSIVNDLIYHLELARGSYKDNSIILARSSMLRESNVLKFVKASSVLRPGYYIGVDPRKKLVVFGIRGTHTVYDLITDIVSSSDGEEVTFDGYSTHFGTLEAARWFLNHELETIRKCLEKYEGFRLRLVGHSLGGAIASLLAIMLRKRPFKELGFSPDIVSAVGFATPPCVSRELAESCSDYVTTVVMQDDIVPRLNAASLARLRNEILNTDWTSIIEKEDWKSVIDLVTNAKHVVSSMQDAARKLADYAKFRTKKESSADPIKEVVASQAVSSTSKVVADNSVALKNGGAPFKEPKELFVPGAVYYLKRNIYSDTDNRSEFFTLWKRHPGVHFEKIVLSNNLISDHRCDSHYYALRDVIKGLPGSSDESIYQVNKS